MPSASRKRGRRMRSPSTYTRVPSTTTTRNIRTDSFPREEVSIYMVTRQVTLRHTWVLLLIGSFLLPLAGCEPTTPTMTTMKPEPPPAGTTWTVASLGDGALDNPRGQVLLSGVAWNGSRFVAVGSNITAISAATIRATIRALIVHSTDGATTWTAASGVSGTGILGGVAWGGGRFVAVGVSLMVSASGLSSSGGLIMSSPDGATWTVFSGVGVLEDRLRGRVSVKPS